jgi:hypothetical protein
LGRFKVICCKCGSDKILEKSSRNQVDCEGTRIIYGEGVQRKCLDCDNEEFYVFKTWEE